MIAAIGLVFVGGGSPASAQTAPPGYYYCNGALILSSQTCTPAGSVSSYPCSATANNVGEACFFNATTAVAPSGTLTVGLPQGGPAPPAVTPTPVITAGSAGPDSGGHSCTNSVFGSTSMTFTCPAGLSAGAQISLTFSQAAGLTETVTYNANGPQAPQTQAAGMCGSATLAQGETSNSSQATCAGVPNSTTVGGDTLDLVFGCPSGPALSSSTGCASILGISAPLSLCGAGTPTPTPTPGSSPISAPPAPCPSGSCSTNQPFVPPPGTTVDIHYVCPSPTGSSPGGIIPAGFVIPATVTNLGSTTTVTNLSETVVSNSNQTATAPTIPNPTSSRVTFTQPQLYYCNGTLIPITVPCSVAPTRTPTPAATTTPTPPLAPTSTPPLPPCSVGMPSPSSVSYDPGWNLIGVPVGTGVTGAGGPLYTYQASDSSYEVLPAGTALQADDGYWANFPSRTTVQLACSTLSTWTITLPANHWIMIGNPFDRPASVTGADIVYAYTPSQGYFSISDLGIGGGA